MRFLPILFITILMLAGCSSFSPRDHRALLEAGLAVWQEFKLDGIIEAYDAQFNFRGQLTIKKDERQLKIYVYRQGALGFSPSYLFKGECQAATYRYELNGEEDNRFLPNLFPYFNWHFSAEEKEQIIENGTLKRGRVSYIFGEQMRIREVSADDFSVRFEYDYSQNPRRIIIMRKENKVAIIYVDKIT